MYVFKYAGNESKRNSCQDYKQINKSYDFNQLLNWLEFIGE